MVLVLRTSWGRLGSGRWGRYNNQSTYLYLFLFGACLSVGLAGLGFFVPAVTVYRCREERRKAGIEVCRRSLIR